MAAVIDAVNMLLKCNQTLGSPEESINESITCLLLSQVIEFLGNLASRTGVEPVSPP
jgi:hypothetical protein